MLPVTINCQIYDILFLSDDIGKIGQQNHYNRYTDVVMSPMASQITGFSVVRSTVYAGADKRNIKAPRHWPFWGEFTGGRWIPLTKGQ